MLKNEFDKPAITVLTLHDFYAAFALIAIAVNEHKVGPSGRDGLPLSDGELAEAAHDLASAMTESRI